MLLARGLFCLVHLFETCYLMVRWWIIMVVLCATAIPVLKFKIIRNSSEITCGYIPQMQS